MKILFSLCWLGEPWRIDRNIKWLEYHRKLKSELAYDLIVLVDNASDLEDLKKLGATVYDEYGDLLHECPGSYTIVYRFYTHIHRTGIWEYPYCWRGLKYLQKLVRELNISKVIGLDTDFYVLTPKLAHYMRDLNSGWVSFFCHKYGFPEAAMWVLCQDSMDRLLAFPVPSFTHYNGRHMEELLPWTVVHKTGFVGDRYGEGRQLQEPWMDWYGQWTDGCPDMKYGMEACEPKK